MLTLIVASCVLVSGTLYVVFCRLIPIIKRYYEKEKIFRKIPSASRVGIANVLLGNIDLMYYFMSHLKSSKGFYIIVSALNSNKELKKDGFQRFYIGWNKFVALYKDTAVETLLTSNTNITKSDNYRNLSKWLGNGLLTSTGDHWKKHRKILTPTFHFKILDSFVPIMNENSQEMIKLIEKMLGSKLDIRSYITNCTLDTICETAMGVRVNAQFGNLQYVKPLKRVLHLLMERVANPLIHNDVIYSLTKSSRENNKNLNEIHSFVRKVIQERSAEIKQLIQNNLIDLNSVDNTQQFYGRKRYAFLDSLLVEHFKNPNDFTMVDIEDEVNTFMFEGHDTTSAGLIFALLLIGHDQLVQDKIYSELESIFGDDMSRAITIEDCRQMKYLEMCVKECLRIYPPVPFFARTIEADFQVEGYTIPSGCQCLIYPFALHRDHDVFPQPERFIPERFAPGSPIHFRPYAYLPFSAGPRNCIGQKFAMLEMKILIGTMLKEFRLKSITHRDQLDIEFSIILKNNSPVMIQFDKRRE